MALSLEQFAAALFAGAVEVVARNHEALKKVGEIVEGTSKDMLGEYQAATFATPAWSPLTQSTQDTRAAQGFTPDDPLLRSGELRDSIGHKVVGQGVAIGSDLDKAAYMEGGTPTVPPRPFLLTAAAQKEKEIAKLIGEGFAANLILP